MWFDEAEAALVRAAARQAGLRLARWVRFVAVNVATGGAASRRPRRPCREGLSMAKDWILVRLQRDTHRELCEVRESMRLADAHGQLELETDDRDRVSLDTVIRQLIAFRAKHAARRRRSAKKKVGKPAAICPPPVSELPFT